MKKLRAIIKMLCSDKYMLIFTVPHSEDRYLETTFLQNQDYSASGDAIYFINSDKA